MLHRSYVGKALRVATAALVMSVALAPAAFAKGGGPDKGKGFGDGNDQSIPNCSREADDADGHENRGDRLFCPNKQTLVRIDEKLCPEKPGRPAVVRKRVCCRHGSMTNCHPFRPCPPRSRS
jgi:hypothetical protein